MTKNKSILHVPLYPFLIALAPVVSLYVLNRLELTILDVVRPATVCLIAALLAVSVSRLVSKSIQGAAILGGVILASMLLYEPAYRSVFVLLKTGSLKPYFLPIWILLTFGIYAVLARALYRQMKSLGNVTLIFNTFGVALIFLALMPLALDKITSNPGTLIMGGQSGSDWTLSENQESERPASGMKIGRPDVYFIILDAYARGDVLQSRYDFNNSDFLDWLEMRGFWVGEFSHSNYPWTHLSLAATMNGEYLQTLLPKNLEFFVPKQSRDGHQFLTAVLGKYYIKRSRTHRFFSSLGYRIYSNDSGYTVTRKTPLDLADAMKGPINEFEQELIRRTIFKSLISLVNNRLSKYHKITRSLEELGSLAAQDGPKFVFYHILSPHPPLCFEEDGEMMPVHPVYGYSAWLSDLQTLPGYHDWIMDRYPKNVSGLNVHVKETVNSIMDESGGNAVIIIQSDHGLNSLLDPRIVSENDLAERFGVLNAIYLPAGFSRSGLDKSMSSVNTFRLVLSNVFGMSLPPLQNRAFYSEGGLDFEEVTHGLQVPN